MIHRNRQVARLPDYILPCYSLARKDTVPRETVDKSLSDFGIHASDTVGTSGQISLTQGSVVEEVRIDRDRRSHTLKEIHLRLPCGRLLTR